MDQETITYKAAPNIALIKYWGKADKNQNLPTNPSLSITLDHQDLATTTSLTIDHQFSFTLNHEVEKPSSRLSKILYELASYPIPGHTPRPSSQPQYPPIKIESVNNFPTASGLASSASAYAALSLALGELYQLELEQMKTIARLGSGSATRGLEGGVNVWEKQGVGKHIDVGGAEEELCVLILLGKQEQKKVGSTDGMERAHTSRLFQERLKWVDQDIEKIIKNMKDRDWNSVFELVMRDSNNFHSVCLDSFPPVFYLDDFSKEVIELVHRVNEISSDKVNLQNRSPILLMLVLMLFF